MQGAAMSGSTLPGFLEGSPNPEEPIDGALAIRNQTTPLEGRQLLHPPFANAGDGNIIAVH